MPVHNDRILLSLESSRLFRQVAMDHHTATATRRQALTGFAFPRVRAKHATASDPDE